MSRTARAKCESGIYHVMLRGNGRQTIFEDDEDRERFVSSLFRFRELSSVEIHAYCLMDNHVHILLRETDGEMEDFMRRLGTGYAKYFNLRHERVGSLFQGRFTSEPVASDEYYMTVLRYILQNPEKAGIAKTEDYPWSSFADLDSEGGVDLTSEGSIDASFAIKLAGGLDLLKKFVLSPSTESCMDVAPFQPKREMHEIAADQGVYLSDLKTLPVDERNAIIREMKGSGHSMRAIERATGIGRGVIQRIR